MRMKYKVLVVDDEPIAVESIIYMLTKNFEEIEICGSARSGKDAIEKAYNLHPDIIIMDINMPGINGLEAMKQIKTVNPNIVFIILSAFDYFDYAVEALNLGVVEYLLKPVKELTLNETMVKALEKIRIREANIQKNLEQQERMEMIIPVLETGFMNSLCLYSGSTKELKDYCQLFGYKEGGGYVMALEFGQKKSHKIENKIGAGVYGEKMYGEYKKIIQSRLKAIVGPIMLNRIIVYVFEENREQDYEQKSHSVEETGRILDRAVRIYPDIFIGIGRYYDSVEEAKKSYQEALFALGVLTGDKESEESQILHVDDILERIEYPQSNYEEQLEEIYLHAAEQGENEVASVFHDVFGRMTRDNTLSFEEIKNSMIGLVTGFSARWKSAAGNYYDVLKEIIGTEEKDGLYSVVKNFLERTVGRIQEGRKIKVNTIIEKANKYMEQYYSREISLEEVAKEVNLSPYYFSRFYKEETGVNFSDRLTEIRMEKAKELLKKDEYTIKDVCYMTGYMEPNYFSKIFKKVTGVTPTEYKRMFGS
ncbi:two component transcriptional regulator, AraC family [Anaerocolumna xylanovorans DSM 12503]|uniref:Stage 0 sporulation protein A homolog n=2 Tax=Anaerocolumna TaxID=1843210 RepID=A0A1M7Y0Q6_9FIRM|nr:two component transcriptional regulator, AraC family [Anaerocolumna xylanovorans DSM 12503]